MNNVLLSNPKFGGGAVAHNKKLSGVNPGTSAGMKTQTAIKLIQFSAQAMARESRRFLGTEPLVSTQKRGLTVSEQQVIDPMVGLLDCFRYIPESYHSELFEDFQEAASSKDLRKLLDTISDWSATAELYANPDLRSEFEDARDGREGIEDWLPLK